MDPLLFSLRNLLSKFIISIYLRRSSAGQATLLRCSAPFWKEPVGWKEFPFNTSRQWCKRMSIGGLWILKIYEDMYLYSGQKNRRQTEEFALDLFERLLESRMSNLPSQAFKQAPLWDQMTFECKTLREKNHWAWDTFLHISAQGSFSQSSVARSRAFRTSHAIPTGRGRFSVLFCGRCNLTQMLASILEEPLSKQLRVLRVVWDMKWSYLVVVRAYVCIDLNSVNRYRHLDEEI